MEFFKAQYARISEQLAGLSSTQKMLTASLVAIMLMTLYWWSKYAAEPEMEPVVASVLSADDIGQITNHLDEKGIQYKVSGGQVLVAADRKMEVLADLTYSRALPRDLKLPFDTMLKEVNPLNDPMLNGQILLESKQRTLAMVISNFPGVAQAIVVIDPTTQLRFDAASIQATASVTITTRHDGRASLKQLANAAADVVSGAEAGLERSRISVVIDGVPFPVQDKDDPMAIGDGGSLVDAMKANEDYYCGKIRQEFGFIPGLRVSVTVKMNTAYSEVTSDKVDPKNNVSLPIHQEEHTSDSTSPGAAGEAGTAPNVGLAVTAASTSGATSNENDTKTDFENKVGLTHDFTKKGPGDATAIGASVRVPQSYLNDQYKQTFGRDPDQASMVAFAAEQMDTIRKDVKANTGIATDEAVVVSSYMDPKPVEPASTTATSSAPVVSMVSGHGKEIGVGILATVSLFMMMMMVRKSTPVPLAMPAVENAEPVSLGGAGEVAGEASEGRAMLDGMELDEDTVKTQSVLDQVQQMVTENPDAAATLVKRWLNR